MAKLEFERVALAFITVAALGACATTGVTRIDPAPAVQSGPRATLARADSAYAAGAYPLAKVLYEELVSQPSPASIAVFRLATLRSWDNRLDESVALYRRYIAQEPRDAEGRIALARTLAWGGHYDAAIATYDTLIAANQRTRDATMARAQTFAWAGRLGDALAVYKTWVRDHPGDREAAIDYARTLAWSGQLDEAEQMYTQLSRTGNTAATKGLARVIGWRGELQRSERTWRRVLGADTYVAGASGRRRVGAAAGATHESHLRRRARVAALGAGGSETEPDGHRSGRQRQRQESIDDAVRGLRRARPVDRCRRRQIHRAQRQRLRHRCAR
jgi:tetratricopeptide (TPR) repeat protein